MLLFRTYTNIFKVSFVCCHAIHGLLEIKVAYNDSKRFLYELPRCVNATELETLYAPLLSLSFPIWQKMYTTARLSAWLFFCIQVVLGFFVVIPFQSTQNLLIILPTPSPFLLKYCFHYSLFNIAFDPLPNSHQNFSPIRYVFLVPWRCTKQCGDACFFSQTEQCSI